MNPRATSALVAAVLAVSFITQCGPRTGSFKMPDEVYPENPFILRVAVQPSEVAMGDPLTLEYSLTNTSDQTISACFDVANEYHVWGARGEAGSDITFSVHGSRDKVFRLPPRTTLVWQVESTVPEVGAGPARLMATFRSLCSLWSGSVVSEPVTLTVASRAQ